MVKLYSYLIQFNQTRVKIIRISQFLFLKVKKMCFLCSNYPKNYIMKKNVLLILSFVAFLFFSCSKSKNDEQLLNKTNEITVKAVKEESQNVITANTDEVVKVLEKEKKVSVKTQVSSQKETKDLSEIEVLRKKHENFLANSPFKNSMQLSKSERKSAGLPPNKYYEQEWELTIDPSTGKPNPINVALLRKKLADERAADLAAGRTPGDASDNNWVERGPNNVGGRVRAVLFDPNDVTNETVFAGGVSGGLWKNTNISNSLSTWSRVNIPDNLAVTSIAVDPNNSNVFYVGTGESYVGGDVNGDGVWKSTDGGTTWTNIFGGITGPTTFESESSITINSPTGIAGNYASYPTTAFGDLSSLPLTRDIVLVQDNTAPASDGCETITNAAALNGKIALIRRGSCSFVIKVKAAQDAGAVAVIMMNNVGGTPIPMGGTDATITIPSVMISQSDGDILEAALGAGSVNGTINPTVTGGFTGNLVPGQQHINDIKVRNNGGTSEIYVAAGDSFYGSANAATYLGGPAFGLYKSVNGGSTWTEVSLPLTFSGNKHCPNDIEIGVDNKIWLSTTGSVVYGDGGGIIFSSTDGNTFTQRYAVANGDRVQIAVSKQAADKVYVLAELSTTAAVGLYRTDNGFATTTTLAVPIDVETSMGTDFTRGQAFYDLMLEVDPNNDQIAYAGGIDLFKSSNSGSSWSQISHWYGLGGYNNVHSDQHGMAFANGSSTVMVFGNDGGVFYSSNSGATIVSRNRGLNITQFYSVGVAPTGATGGNLSGEYFAAGAQDNGTQYFGGVGAGINASFQSQGGDGAYTMFDQGVDKYYISNYVYNNSINYRTTAGATRVINSESGSNGAFIAPMTLDSSLDILYADYSTSAPVYQIRRYTNLKSGTVGKTLLTNALLTSSATAMTVSKYTTTSTTLLIGCRNGKLLKLTNANSFATWTDITGSGFVGSISDVEYGQSENEIFVTMHNYNVISIWYTSNGGTTWQNKEGNFPDIPVKAILQNPLNLEEVIIGTELGVWYTNNFSSASPTWNQSYNGMSNVKVVDLDLRNDNTVFAATYGRGIFSGMFTSTVLSNQDVVVDNRINIYPNPSNGIVNIAIANYSGSLKVSLVDLNGRVVYSNEINDFSLEQSINVKNYQSGVYLLNLEGENIKLTRKIIFE